jgi:imidazolonepropionase-like amidohydrolase
MSEPAHDEPRSFAIKDVRIFDGVETTKSGNVVLRGGIIAQAGEGAKLTDVEKVIDGRGRTLMPGLLDAHFHILGRPEVALHHAAALGATTVVDMGGGRELNEVRRVAMTDPRLADLVGAGQQAIASDSVLRELFAGEGLPTIDSPEEAPRWMEERAREGSDFIKIVYDEARGGSLSTETVRAIIGAAHAHGKRVWVHALAEDKARLAIDAGADGLAHLFVGESAGSGFGRSAARHGISVIPTLSVLLTCLCGMPQAPVLLQDPRLAPCVRAQQEEIRSWRQDPDKGRLFRATREAISQLISEKVPILAGTDAAPELTGVPWGASLHGELELLVAEGLTPTQALVAATSATAKAFGLADRGSLRAGMRADLLLVDGDPTSDITSTRGILGVWKAGIPVK